MQPWMNDLDGEVHFCQFTNLCNFLLLHLKNYPFQIQILSRTITYYLWICNNVVMNRFNIIVFFLRKVKDYC